MKKLRKKQKEKNNIKQSSSAMAPQQQTQDHLISSKTILSKSHVNNFNKIMQFAVKFPWNDNRFTHGTESVEIRWKQMWNGKKRRPADREEDKKKPSQIESVVVERQTTEDARTRTHTFCHSSMECIQFVEIDRCHSPVVLSTRRTKAASTIQQPEQIRQIEINCFTIREIRDLASIWMAIHRKTPIFNECTSRNEAGHWDEIRETFAHSTNCRRIHHI